VTTLNGVTTTSIPVTTTYGFDAHGNQTSVTSANGTTTTCQLPSQAAGAPPLATAHHAVPCSGAPYLNGMELKQS
jgi:hypothetical protein